MVCQVLVPPAMEFFVQKKKQAILKNQLLIPKVIRIIGFGQEVCLKKEN